MNRSMPGLPVHHQLPEFTQTQVHRVSNTIQPSHPLSSPSPPALNLSQHRVFSKESALRISWPKYWSFSFNISPSNEHPLHCRWILYQLSSLSLELYLELYLKWAYDPVETGVAMAAEIAPFIKYLLRPR